MGLNIFKIKKWTKMLFGNSILHVNQNMGKSFEKGQIKGYFNNMTEKVTKDLETLSSRSLPKMFDDRGREVVFPVTIIQYGLGTYDLILQTGKIEYIEQFKKCVDWVYDNQLTSGAWSMADYLSDEAPYGAMCQGEGASLLLRAYSYYNDNKYLERAINAIDFMLLPVDEGGTSVYKEDDLILMEFTNRPCVLNGWVFALFGLYDLTLVYKDEKYKIALDRTFKTLKKNLPKFDCGYWTMYNTNGMIASPFYHKLHIAQFQALETATGDMIYKEYADKWQKYQGKQWNCKRAFLKKAVQKILERT